MKKISVDFRKGYAKVKIENPDDLWYLNGIIDPGDFVSGRTLRKIKTGGDDARKSNITKKPVYIKIRVEKLNYKESILKVLGTIEEGPEDIPRGEHHSFNFEVGTEFKIYKKWHNYQINKLKEAFETKISKILIVLFDREEAFFAIMKKNSFDILAHIQGKVAKKDNPKVETSNFYAEIIKTTQDYNTRLKLDNIILASPAFWKDELLKNLTDDNIKKKMVMATASSVTKQGINEVLKRDEVKNVLAGDRVSKEIRLVEALIKEIGDEGKASYGIRSTKNAADAGAVNSLLVTDKLIQKYREIDKFDKLEEIMKSTDKAKSQVHIISSTHEGGKKLDGLGGIGAILRYKLN